jgi:hypothetical protein
MRRFSGPIIAALGIALSGCASLFGITDQVSISSEPSGAACRVERLSQPVALIKETPATITVPRSHYPIDVYCIKEGTAGAETVWPGVNPLVYGDLLGGGVPYLVDTLTDADRTLPETIVVRFPVTGQ